MISALIIINEQERNRQVKQLVSCYGQAEVSHAMTNYNKTIRSYHLGNENIIFYQDYIDFYRRFGEKRPLLTLEQFKAANEEFGVLFTRREVGQTLTISEQERLAHLIDLLLKEARFWDDLVPENPPPKMPEIKLPILKKTAPHPAAGHCVDSYPVCPNDGFPMITINGRLECCVEFLDRYVGGQKVVDVVQHNQITCYEKNEPLSNGSA